MEGRNKDILTTIRLSRELMHKLKSQSTATNKSINSIMVESIAMSFGLLHNSEYPSIIKTADDQILWVSPLGNFGEVDATAWTRFCAGYGTGILAGTRWVGSFVSIADLIIQTGASVICRWDKIGLLIVDHKAFWELCDKYKTSSYTVN